MTWRNTGEDCQYEFCLYAGVCNGFYLCRLALRLVL